MLQPLCQLLCRVWLWTWQMYPFQYPAGRGTEAGCSHLAWPAEHFLRIVPGLCQFSSSPPENGVKESGSSGHCSERTGSTVLMISC